MSEPENQKLPEKAEALPPPREKISDEKATEAAKQLGGAFVESMDVKRVRAMQTLGDWLEQPGLAPVLITDTFANLQQVNKGMAVALAIASSTKNSAKVKLAAVAVMNQCAKAHAELVGAMLDLSAAAGTPIGPKGGKNAPPNLLFSIQNNVTGGKAAPPIIDAST